MKKKVTAVWTTKSSMNILVRKKIDTIEYNCTDLNDLDTLDIIF